MSHHVSTEAREGRTFKAETEMFVNTLISEVESYINGSGVEYCFQLLYINLKHWAFKFLGVLCVILITELFISLYSTAIISI